MRRLRLIHALAAVVGAALVLSACGGDDSPEQPIIIPTETTTGSLGKDEFIEEADAVCAEANAAIAEFVANGEGFSASGEIASLRASVIDELQALGPPDDDRATYDSFIAGFEAQVEAGEKIALANERGADTAEFETELDAAQAETLTAAESYGFTECGQEASASSTGTSDTGAAAPSAPVTPAPSTPDTSGGGVGDTGGDTGDGGGGVSPGGGVGPG
jgi:hypothetical protein